MGSLDVTRVIADIQRAGGLDTKLLAGMQDAGRIGLAGANIIRAYQRAGSGENFEFGQQWFTEATVLVCHDAPGDAVLDQRGNQQIDIVEQRGRGLRNLCAVEVEEFLQQCQKNQ